MNAEEARALSVQNKDYWLRKSIEYAEQQIQEAANKGEFAVLISKKNGHSDQVMDYLKAKGFKVEYITKAYGMGEKGPKITRLEVQW